MQKNGIPYIPRDLSWLSFNYRVLQEAKDQNVPLFERIKFLAIYSSNLDEFFRVRVSQLRSLAKIGKKAKRELEYDPSRVLEEVISTVNTQQEEFSSLFKEIVAELREYNIFIIKRQNLSEEQQAFVEDYFQDHMLPFVQPVLLVEQKVKPFLNHSALYIALNMHEKAKPNTPVYAIVKVPSDHLSRFIELPTIDTDRKEIIILDDVVRHFVIALFPGYVITSAYSIKQSRDAELYIEDEYSGDLVQKIKRSLSKRDVGSASRLVYDRKMPVDQLKFLMHTFGLENQDLLPEGRYHNNFDFFQFRSFGPDSLKDEPLPPLQFLPLEDVNDIFTALRAEEYLLHFPYHSYESVIRFFEDAAEDPYVTHIKVVQYRVAKKSRIMDALMRAAELGKRVSVFVEVKARFDEAANLEWAAKLEEAGVAVRYSFPGLKVHAKVALIIRQEENSTRFYSYLSTGNFHEETAKLYSDFGFFTTQLSITREVARLFSYLETVQLPSSEFEHLLVGQFNLRKKLIEYIDYEIAQAKMGKEAEIILKLNSLQDYEMIEKLYVASQAGVRIRMIIRGINCLAPGVLGWSENIHAISIVDRFLEHARIYVFHNGGNRRIYLASADWMERNLSYRIETAFPIYNAQMREQILDILEVQFMDNVKARLLDFDQSNSYHRNQEDINVRSQVETYFYLKRLMEEYKIEETDL